MANNKGKFLNSEQMVANVLQVHGRSEMLPAGTPERMPERSGLRHEAQTFPWIRQ